MSEPATHNYPPEEIIYQDFSKRGLSIVDAILQLEHIGYSSRDAEELVHEWADALSACGDDCPGRQQES